MSATARGRAVPKHRSGSEEKQRPLRVDVAVAGGGAAGLYAAICVAREGASVGLLTATPLAQTASYWAQGGLAAAVGAEDSFELHLADTLRAGRVATRRSAAEALVREAPERLSDLQALGLRFDADRFGALALGLEGGHSVRRIVHAGGSATGRRMLRQLSALVAEHRGIAVFEGERGRVRQLLMHDGRCVGVACESGELLQARAILISAGGAAALWARTTNPPGSIGTGLLLAHAAGAQLADLELVQFHPTAVIGVRGREGFLITEAIRGEGATLHNAKGERFVDELAPRDEVSSAIAAQLADSGSRSVGLDMRAIDPALFPNVIDALRRAGLDPTRELIPVAPAAHYTMGGIVTDLHARTNVPGLYALGESACTGLHGANRLASNSLSECFVFAHRAALAATSEPPCSSLRGLREASRTPLPQAPKQGTREALWLHANVNRDAVGLEALANDPHPLARAIAHSALERRESRGAHRRSDHPRTDPALDLRHIVVGPDAALRFETWE
jgi:L-aspartate oxidase